MNKTLYLDMDGVLADFDSFAHQLLGPQSDPGSSERWPQEQWQQLARVPNLYLQLPKMPLADRMADLARRFRDELGWDLYLLTATPKANDVPDSFYDKVIWTQQHFPDITVRFGPYSKDKQNHCRPGDILVDDRESNCLEWQQRGGEVIRVRKGQYTRALDQLKQRLDQELSKDS